MVDDLSTGRRVNLDAALAGGAELAEVDIRDAEALTALAAEKQPQKVFHLAAQIDVRKSVEDPAFDAAINVGGTTNVLDAARAGGVSRVVFISTGGALYGEGADKELPLDESTAIEPMSGYGQSKYAAEGYLGLYERLYGLSSMALRLGNVYGPRQDPLGEAGVIAIFCGLLEKGGRPTIYGDGTQTRDYIYVGDVVAAALAAPSPRSAARSTSAPARDERARAGRGPGPPQRRENFEPEFAPPRAGEVQRITLDAGRAERELGWRPETRLDDGLKLTLDAV